jgi:hypothetical protein
MPLTALLWAVGAVATAIRQITNAEDRPICIKGRLSCPVSRNVFNCPPSGKRDRLVK